MGVFVNDVTQIGGVYQNHPALKLKKHNYQEKSFFITEFSNVYYRQHLDNFVSIDINFLCLYC